MFRNSNIHEVKAELESCLHNPELFLQALTFRQGGGRERERQREREGEGGREGGREGEGEGSCDELRSPLCPGPPRLIVIRSLKSSDCAASRHVRITKVAFVEVETLKPDAAFASFLSGFPNLNRRRKNSTEPLVSLRARLRLPLFCQGLSLLRHDIPGTQGQRYLRAPPRFLLASSACLPRNLPS